MAKERRTETFTLPCGYLNGSGELHTEMTVVELDHKIDKAMADQNLTSSELLARHVTKLGTICDREGIDEAVPKLQKGDFDWALIKLRVLSLGGSYEYPMLCPNPKCRCQRDYEYDLDGIEVVDMPDPHNDRFVYTSDGVELVFQTLKAGDMEDLAELMEDRENEVERVLAFQLVSVGGETPEALLKKRGRKCKNANQRVQMAIKMLEDAEIFHREREAIRKGLRGIRGYPNRRIKGTCPECRTNFWHVLPIDYTFIVPSLVVQTQHGSL